MRFHRTCTRTTVPAKTATSIFPLFNTVGFSISEKKNPCRTADRLKFLQINVKFAQNRTVRLSSHPRQTTSTAALQDFKACSKGNMCRKNMEGFRVGLYDKQPVLLGRRRSESHQMETRHTRNTVVRVRGIAVWILLYHRVIRTVHI